MIILDTNVISEMSRSTAHAGLVAWASLRSEDELYLCAPVIAELYFGAQRFVYRNNSRTLLDTITALVNKSFQDRILPFDESSAKIAGEMRAYRESIGRPVFPVDMSIAGICRSHNATLATRNIRDFEGLDLKLVNPFEG